MSGSFIPHRRAIDAHDYPRFVIALAGLVIASGALQLSTLEAAEGEMLQMSDYLSEIGTLASGLGMLGLAEVLRLLLRITA